MLENARIGIWGCDIMACGNICIDLVGMAQPSKALSNYKNKKLQLNRQSIEHQITNLLNLLTQLDQERKNK